MKASKSLRVALLAFVPSLLITAVAAAGARQETSSQPKKRKTNEQYVMVTGSHIPQKMKIQAIGTKTASPVRVYDRREIDQTGRNTVTQILAEDPAVHVLGH